MLIVGPPAPHDIFTHGVRSLFSHIVPRIKSIELAGDPGTMQTAFAGGHKSLPIRYELTN